MNTLTEHYILKINCPATSGIVAAISDCLARQSATSVNWRSLTTSSPGSFSCVRCFVSTTV